jgi:hypothetical protein
LELIKKYNKYSRNANLRLIKGTRFEIASSKNELFLRVFTGIQNSSRKKLFFILEIIKNIW